MIVTIWFLVSFLIDTPERRIGMEARLIAERLELYNRGLVAPITNLKNDTRCA